MQVSQWTLLDLIFVAIILTSVGFAVTKGLMREIISLVALVGGFILAAFFYPRLGASLSPFTKTNAIADLIAFLIIFLSCLLAGGVVAAVVNRFVKMASLEWLDRILGGTYGLLRGWAVASVITLALIAFPVRPNLVSRSLLAPYLMAGARAAIYAVPKELKNRFYEEYQKVLNSWNSQRNPA